MPTKKQRMIFIMNEEYLKKFEILKTKLKRKSNSDMIMYLIEDYIDRYEKENGNLEGD